MVRFFVFLSVLAIAHSVAIAEVSRDPNHDYWTHTGLSINEFIESEVPSCKSDALHVIACVEALNEMGRSLNPPMYFTTPAEALQSPEVIGKIQFSASGKLNLYEYAIDQSDHPDSQFLEILAKEKAYRKSHYEALRALSADTAGIDFEKLFRMMSARTLLSDEKNHPERLAASVFNSFLAIVQDPHTMLWSKEAFDEMLSGDGDKLIGIGVNFKIIKKQWVVISNFKDGPAMKAGIKPGDTIESVDGKSIVGLKSAEATVVIMGPVGTRVILGVLRGKTHLKITVIRAEIRVANVEYSVVSDRGVPYGYIKLASFMPEETVKDVTRAIKELKAKNKVKGFILDLRQNGGGQLLNAIRLGGLFLGKQKIVGEKNLFTMKMKWDFAEEDALDLDTPLVTLIDGGSASASEILAGAFQDYQRSWLVGDRTFGKATVQGPVSLPGFSENHPGVLIYSTFERFYLPSGRTNQIVGIIPDFSVDPVLHATDLEKYVPREEENYTALPALSKVWSQVRPSAVEQINRCRAKLNTEKKSADQIYTEQSKDAEGSPDYRLLVAQDILSCSENLGKR